MGIRAENPGAPACATGAEKGIHVNADAFSTIAQNETTGTYKSASRIGHCAADCMRALYLQRMHGLSEAQAQALSILVWGISNG